MTDDFVKICLVNGIEQQYYCCHPDKSAYDDTPILPNLEWIGQGTIKTIDGVPQHGGTKYYFWRKKKNLR